MIGALLITPVAPGMPVAASSAIVAPAPRSMPSAIENFAGMGTTTTPAIIQGAPPDPTGAVGPNHYVQMVNGGIEVFHKNGTSAAPAAASMSLWSGYSGTNAGNGCSTQPGADPIVRYDRMADRWIVSQLSLPNLASGVGPSFECVAVSKTGDPTGDYWRYDFSYPYYLVESPKIGVWPDAYYVTFNAFSDSSTFSSARVCAWNRTSMLQGLAPNFQCFQQSASYYGILPADLDGASPPPTGSPEYLLALDLNPNLLDAWTFHVDWSTPGNSTLTALTPLSTAAYTDACPNAPAGYGRCIPEVGGGPVDSLTGRLMDRLAYRNFGDHQSLVVNHSVTAGTEVGIRWYELRIANQIPSIYQQGTYDLADGQFRWLGSVAQDQSGDMALGFSASSSSINPQIRLTGRLAAEAPGSMGQGESTVVSGAGSESGSNGFRWGDYSSMTVDPSDDCTFWYTNEYYPTSGLTTWQTQIVSFKFPSCLPRPAVAVLPAMSNGAYGGYVTAATIQNTGTVPAGVGIAYFDQSGAPVGAGDSVENLLPNASWTVRQDNGHGFPNTGGDSARAGSAVVYSTQPIAAFVNEFAPGNVGDATSYTGVPVPSGVGNTLHLPAIANGAYGGYTTGIGLLNQGGAATDVTVTYRDSSGSVVKSQAVLGLGAHAYHALYSGDAVLALPSGFAGTATIVSTGQPLGAIVNETGPGGQFSSYDAVPSGSTILDVPAALNHAFNGYNTGMGIQNTSGTAGTVTVTYYDSAGASTVKTFSIAADGYLGVYQGGADGPPASGPYTAVIQSTLGLAAIVNEVAPPSGTSAQQSTAYNTFSGGSSALHLALVENSGPDPWNTGEGIMNTGAGSTTVTVSYYNVATGAAVGTAQSRSLAANAFWGLYQPAGGLPGGTAATAVVTTTSGGQVAVICNESGSGTFMSYGGQ